jgi:arylsulfatase A
MDHAFGRLMQTLDTHDLRENTMVFFTSDNGPAITRQHPHGSPGPLREKKGHLYEGGIRIPGIIRWPGHTRAGTVSDEPISGVDLLPTLCAVTGLPVPDDRPIDGASFLPIFDGKPIHRETPLYWQFNFARSKPKVAMRIGDWKILAHLTGPELKPGGDILETDQNTIKTAELAAFELYNLRDDTGETRDLAKTQPRRLQQMSATLRRLYRDVRDESPTWPAWDWPHIEGKRIREHRKAQAAKSKPAPTEKQKK